VRLGLEDRTDCRAVSGALGDHHDVRLGNALQSCRKVWRLTNESFRQAIALAPDLVEAHVGLARYVLTEYLYGAHETADFAEGERSAQRAIAIDDKEASAYYAIAFYYAHRGDIESAVAAARAAVDLNPNFALAHFRLGQILGFAGHLGASITAIDVGLRLSPNDPQAFFWLTFKGWAQYLLGRYEEALKTALAANRSRALPFVYRLLIATYGQLGLKAEAAAAIVEAKSVAEITRGKGVLSTFDPNLPYAGANSPHADRSQLALAREGLRKAGLALKAKLADETTMVTTNRDGRFGSCVTSIAGPNGMRNCTGDEGRPFEFDNQVLISSHRKLLWSKAMVASVAEKPEQDSGRQD
jgi:tetratricopeptide (TPR) repeat protein